MIVERVSPMSGKLNRLELPITQEQVLAYNNGALIQDAFPQLTASQREFIQTGYTPEEWDQIFADESD